MPFTAEETATLKTIRRDLERLKDENPALAGDFEDLITLLDFAPSASADDSVDSIRAKRKAPGTGDIDNLRAARRKTA